MHEPEHDMQKPRQPCAHVPVHALPHVDPMLGPSAHAELHPSVHAAQHPRPHVLAHPPAHFALSSASDTICCISR